MHWILQPLVNETNKAICLQQPAQTQIFLRYTNIIHLKNSVVDDWDWSPIGGINVKVMEVQI